ncbi:MAG: hypothetical protein ABSG76_22660, partial [Xanthobacteraceae bacterium]
MTRVAYLLHRFPGITDTFIKREIRSLQRAGTDVCVISVWKPRGTETTCENMSDWSADTQFVLPRPALSVLKSLVGCAIRRPARLALTARLAFLTARPGLRGLLFQ